MDGNAYLLGLGKIVSNLQSLEVCLRVFLCDANGQTFKFPKPGDNSLPDSYLTNYDSLGKLVGDYNAMLDVGDKVFEVDSQVVHIRDALAHGRLMSPGELFPLTLFRFDRPANGSAGIRFIVELTEAWFEKNRKLIHEQMMKVVECSKKRNYPSIG